MSCSYRQSDLFLRAGQDDFRHVYFDTDFCPFPSYSSYFHVRQSHVKNPDELPSKELLQEHFKYCLYRNFAGVPNLETADFNRHMEILINRHMILRVDLSRECWRTGQAKEALELYIAQRLFGSMLSSLDGNTSWRWSKSRLERNMKISTPSQIQNWPEYFKLPEDEPFPPFRSESEYDEEEPIQIINF